MRSYRLLTPARCREMLDDIRLRDWKPGFSVREHGKVKVCSELASDDEVAAPLLEEIRQAIFGSAIPSREYLDGVWGPRFQRYEVGQKYDFHVDAPYMGRTRTDLAFTLFLNEDYEGGELKIDRMLPGGNAARVKGPPGTCAVYECWRPHQVEPVTEGERIVALGWIQSKIPEAAHRQLLEHLQRVLDDIEVPQGGELRCPQCGGRYPIKSGTSLICESEQCRATGKVALSVINKLTPQEIFAHLGAVNTNLVKRFSR